DGALVVEGSLRQSAALVPGAIAAICKEAAGNPFLLGELARLHVENPHWSIPTIATVVRRRLSILSVDEWALVELVAIAPGAVAAADAALKKLAHARAVELYQLALRHEGDRQRIGRLKLRLGEALEGTGRFAESAEHYRAGLPDAAIPPVEATRIKIHLANCL